MSDAPEQKKPGQDHAEREIQRPLSLVGPPFLTGPDVRATQEAIVEDFKHLGLPITLKHVDGEFGERTKRKMNRVLFFLGVDPAGDKPAGPMFTQDEQRLVRNPDSRNAEQRDRSKRRVEDFLKAHQAAGGFDGARDKIVELALRSCADEPRIHYSQTRPYPKSYVLDLYTDCSGLSELLALLSGAPDPSDLDYSGYGFTGTVLTGTEHVPAAESLRGNFIVYGAGSGHHMVIAIENGADPECVSHGQEKGPFKIRHSVEAQYQPPGVTFCNLLDD